MREVREREGSKALDFVGAARAEAIEQLRDFAEVVDTGHARESDAFVERVRAVGRTRLDLAA